MRRFVSSLVFKISAAILLMGTIALSTLGWYYVRRFSEEIDARILAKLRIPGTLMNQERLGYNIVRDREALRRLVGEDIEEALVIRKDGTVFYSLKPETEGKSLAELLGQKAAAAAEPGTEERVRKNAGPGGRVYLSVVSPLYAKQQLIGHLHLLVDTSASEAEKRSVATLFAVSSALCILLTTLAQVILVHAITGPRLARTVQCLRAVEAGDLQARIAPIRGHDEIGELQASVNAMLHEVQKRTEQRRRAEEALRESESRFRSLFASMSEGMALHELLRAADGSIADYVILDVNPAYERLTGIERARAVGARASELYGAGEPPHLKEYGQVASSGVAAQLDTYFAPMDKHFRIAVFSPGPERFATLFEDISERRKAEQEKARLEDQLRQAQKMEAVGRLAGGIAHDFNNLLTGIIGHVSLALTDLRPEQPLYAALSTVNQSASSAAALTRQLLAFSRKQLIEPRVLQLDALIENLRKMLVRLIGEHIELVTIPQPGLGNVNADPGQLEQVLVNLVVNARDAMPNGGRLAIETADVELDAAYCQAHPPARPGPHVMLAVHDNGTGMSTETRRHIFEPFFTTKPQGQGTGLGLAMVYGAVEQNGGFIDVDSELGRGTSFKIYLPRVEAAPEPLPQPMKQAPLPQGSETILLVEDEPVVRELAKKLLKICGYTVLSASNGAEALGLAEKHEASIELLLTDVVMPGMNGRALAERLQAGRPGLRVLMTSGYTENLATLKGMLGRRAQFLAKPYTPQMLAAKVRDVLDAGG